MRRSFVKKDVSVVPGNRRVAGTDAAESGRAYLEGVMSGRVFRLCVGASVAFAIVVLPLNAAPASSSKPIFPARILTVHGALGQNGGPILGLALDGIHAAYGGGVQTKT